MPEDIPESKTFSYSKTTLSSGSESININSSPQNINGGIQQSEVTKSGEINIGKILLMGWMYFTDFAPLSGRQVIEYQYPQMKIPQGWRSIGNIGIEGSIADGMGIEKSNIEMLMYYVLRRKGLPLTTLKRQKGEFYNSKGGRNTYYSPRAISGLVHFIKSMQSIAYKSAARGVKVSPSTLSNLLNIDLDWVRIHVPRLV